MFGTQASGENGRIAFASDRRAGEDLDIWSMRPDGGGTVNLTADSVADDFGPSWSPDGRNLVFQRDFDPVVGEVDYDLLTMRPDGSGQVNRTQHPAFDIQPDWQPLPERHH